MAVKHWSLDDIDWSRFDARLVSPDLVAVIKTAAMVERNGADYGRYLNGVFQDDPAFRAAAAEWAKEEEQHGLALGRWAALADPAFDMDASFARFTGMYKIPVDAQASIRGSRTGELCARCVVETGTSSFYSAIRDAVDEPVLKQICKNIAADEFRHYKLFYDHLRRCLARDRLSRLARLRIGWGRLAESEDDELAYAYFAANEPVEAVYDRKRCARAYARRAYPLYRESHVQRAMAMVLKAVGLRPQGRLNSLMTRAGLWFLRRNATRYAAQGA